MPAARFKYHLLTVILASRLFLCLAAGGALWAQSPCAECHPQIVRTFAQTGMGRSFYKPRAEARQSSPPYHHVASDTWYAMVQRDGKLFQRRWRVGPNNTEMHVQELSV